MSYARIDDLLAHQRPIMEAGKAGPMLLGWHLAGHQYAERHRTDGAIPAHGLALLCPGAGRPSAKVLEQLQAAGLWAPLADGAWLLVDYPEWNDPIAVRSDKARRAARVRWDAQRMRNASAAHDATHAPDGDAQMPIPRPSPVLPPPRPVLPRPEGESEGGPPPPAAPPTRPVPGRSHDQDGAGTGAGGSGGGGPDGEPVMITPAEAQARIAAVVQRVIGAGGQPSGAELA